MKLRCEEKEIEIGNILINNGIDDIAEISSLSYINPCDKTQESYCNVVLGPLPGSRCQEVYFKAFNSIREIYQKFHINCELSYSFNGTVHILKMEADHEQY
jgi:hypothetical protein